MIPLMVSAETATDNAKWTRAIGIFSIGYFLSNEAYITVRYWRALITVATMSVSGMLAFGSIQ